MECSGDETQSCGGVGAKVTVYSNAQPKKFLGQCIQDYQNNRILNDAFKDQGSTDRQVGPRGIGQKICLGQLNQPHTDFEKILWTDADRESRWTGQCVDLYLRLW